MKNHRADYSLAIICQRFTVSRRGYYAWLRRTPSVRGQQQQLVDQQMNPQFHQHRQR